MIGSGFSALIVYAPPFNVAFGTSHRLDPINWLVPLGTGVFILFYASMRTLLIRKLRPQFFNPEISGLQMWPTRWSTRSVTSPKGTGVGEGGVE
jgi:sodium/potassium-transporting ATPase subunit alpha